MILTHGANSLESGEDFVEIGGRRYKAVKIGNQLWMAENLDYKFNVNGSQIPIGPTALPTTPAAWYYNNDELTYGVTGYKCGLLYNQYAVNYLDDNKSSLLPQGWHVPSIQEFETLLNTAGSASIAGTKLKALDGSIASNFPSEWNGTDDYGMSIIPGGAYYGPEQGGFVSIERYAGLRSITRYNNLYVWMIDFNKSSSSGVGYDEDKFGYSIRLVKDAT